MNKDKFHVFKNVLTQIENDIKKVVYYHILNSKLRSELGVAFAYGRECPFPCAAFSVKLIKIRLENVIYLTFEFALLHETGVTAMVAPLIDD